MTPSCPSPGRLELLLADRLDPDEDAALSRHIEECPMCQALLSNRIDNGSGVSISADNSDGQEAPEDVLRRLKGRPPEPTLILGSGSAISLYASDAAFSLSELVAADQLPVIPGYDVLEEVGRGGMGVIYRARDQALNRIVALKMIRAGLHTSSKAVVRFRTEASAVARLHHPNIVQIYEVGEANGLPYLALEFVAGGSLRQQLDGTPRPPQAAAALVEMVARAVDAAHQRGIVHRDLKPANILLQPEPGSRTNEVDKLAEKVFSSVAWARFSFVPKVSDFGLAKLLDGDGSSVEALTQTGEVLGTPSYMAPEQARPGQTTVGTQADVYALGAVLYELLTGRPPFAAQSPLDTLLRVVHDDPISVTRLSPSVPRDLATVTMKCLEKDPARRYRTAGALADELARFQAGQPVRARPLGYLGRAWRWCRRNPVVTLLLAALAVVFPAGFGATLWEMHQAQLSAAIADAARDQAEQRERTAIARHRRAERDTALSLLDQGIAQCRQGDLQTGLLLLAAGVECTERAGTEEELDHTLRANLAAWCRELLPHQPSRAIPEARPDRLDWLGEAVIGPVCCELPYAQDVLAVAYSPDGRQIVTGSADHTARLWDAATGRPLGVPLLHRSPVWTVAFHPTRPLLATGDGFFCSPSGEFGPGQAQLWDARTAKPVGPPLPANGPVLRVAFSPDGHHLLTCCANERARMWEVPQPVGGKPQRVRVWVEVLTGWELDEAKTPQPLSEPERQRRRDYLEALGGPLAR